MPPVDVPGYKQTIKYKGIFDFDKFYKMVYSWMMGNNYYFEEPSYKHKVPSEFGAEDEVEIKGWIKVNSYVRYWIFVTWHTWDQKEVEVIKEGKKVMLTKARIWIELKNKVELDYDDYFGKSKFTEALRTFLNKIVLKSRIENVYTDELHYRMLKLHNLIKEYLDNETKTNAFYDVW